MLYPILKLSTFHLNATQRCTHTLPPFPYPLPYDTNTHGFKQGVRTQRSRPERLADNSAEPPPPARIVVGWPTNASTSPTPLPLLLLPPPPVLLSMLAPPGARARTPSANAVVDCVAIISCGGMGWEGQIERDRDRETDRQRDRGERQKEMKEGDKYVRVSAEKNGCQNAVASV